MKGNDQERRSRNAKVLDFLSESFRLGKAFMMDGDEEEEEAEFFNERPPDTSRKQSRNDYNHTTTKITTPGACRGRQRTSQQHQQQKHQRDAHCSNTKHNSFGAVLGQRPRHNSVSKDTSKNFIQHSARSRSRDSKGNKTAQKKITNGYSDGNHVGEQEQRSGRRWPGDSNCQTHPAGFSATSRQTNNSGTNGSVSRDKNTTGSSANDVNKSGRELTSSRPAMTTRNGRSSSFRNLTLSSSGHKKMPRSRSSRDLSSSVDNKMMSTSMRELSSSGQKTMAATSSREMSSARHRPMISTTMRHMSSGDKKIISTSLRDLSSSGQEKMIETSAREMSLSDHKKMMSMSKKEMSSSGHRKTTSTSERALPPSSPKKSVKEVVSSGNHKRMARSCRDLSLSDHRKQAASRTMGLSSSNHKERISTRSLSPKMSVKGSISSSDYQKMPRSSRDLSLSDHRKQAANRTVGLSALNHKSRMSTSMRDLSPLSPKRSFKGSLSSSDHHKMPARSSRDLSSSEHTKQAASRTIGLSSSSHKTRISTSMRELSPLSPKKSGKGSLSSSDHRKMPARRSRDLSLSGHRKHSASSMRDLSMPSCKKMIKTMMSRSMKELPLLSPTKSDTRAGSSSDHKKMQKCRRDLSSSAHDKQFASCRGLSLPARKDEFASNKDVLSSNPNKRSISGRNEDVPIPSCDGKRTAVANANDDRSLSPGPRKSVKDLSLPDCRDKSTVSSAILDAPMESKKENDSAVKGATRRGLFRRSLSQEELDEYTSSSESSSETPPKTLGKSSRSFLGMGQEELAAFNSSSSESSFDAAPVSARRTKDSTSKSTRLLNPPFSNLSRVQLADYDSSSSVGLPAEEPAQADNQKQQDAEARTMPGSSNKKRPWHTIPVARMRNVIRTVIATSKTKVDTHQNQNGSPDETASLLERLPAETDPARKQGQRQLQGNPTDKRGDRSALPKSQTTTQPTAMDKTKPDLTPRTCSLQLQDLTKKKKKKKKKGQKQKKNKKKKKRYATNQVGKVKDDDNLGTALSIPTSQDTSMIRPGLREGTSDEGAAAKWERLPDAPRALPLASINASTSKAALNAPIGSHLDDKATTKTTENAGDTTTKRIMPALAEEEADGGTQETQLRSTDARRLLAKEEKEGFETLQQSKAKNLRKIEIQRAKRDLEISRGRQKEQRREEELQNRRRELADSARRLHELEDIRLEELDIIRVAMDEEKMLMKAEMQRAFAGSLGSGHVSGSWTELDAQQEIRKLEVENKLLESTFSNLEKAASAVRGEIAIMEDDKLEQEKHLQTLVDFIERETQKNEKLVQTESKLRNIQSGLLQLVFEAKHKNIYRRCIYKCVHGVQMNNQYTHDHELLEQVTAIVTEAEADLNCDFLDWENIRDLENDEQVVVVSPNWADESMSEISADEGFDMDEREIGEFDEGVDDYAAVLSSISSELGEAQMATLHENKMMLMTIFKLLDRDGSGEIDKEEFELGVQMLNKRLPDATRFKDHEALFRALDADGNGMIDLDEFAQIFN